MTGGQHGKGVAHAGERGKDTTRVEVVAGRR